MTNSGTWKRRERKIAAFFGTKRTPLSGGNSGHGTRSDSLHDKFYIEAKYRARQAVWNLYLETDELASKEGKKSILTLCQKNEQGFLIVVHNEDFEEVCVDFLTQRGFVIGDCK